MTHLVTDLHSCFLSVARLNLKSYQFMKTSLAKLSGRSKAFTAAHRLIKSMGYTYIKLVITDSRRAEISKNLMLLHVD